MVNSSKQHLADLAHVAPLVLAKEQLIAVPPPFQDLLPAVGLQRGWATSVVGSPAGRVFAWALLSELTRSGGWIATVDVSGINLTAANEVGLSIERVLVVSGTDAQNWAPTMGALVGAVDVIVYGAPAASNPAEYVSQTDVSMSRTRNGADAIAGQAPRNQRRTAGRSRRVFRCVSSRLERSG